MRKSLILGTILVLIFTILPVADAYQARWEAAKAILTYEVKVEKTGKFKAKEKVWEDPIYLDSSFGTKVQWKIGVGLDAPTFEAGVMGKSDRKAVVDSVEKKVVEDFMGQVDDYLDEWNTNGRSLSYQGITYDEIKVKGKLNVNGKYDKCSLKLKLKFTGTVTDGEHAGKPVKGALQLTLKGDRTF